MLFNSLEFGLFFLVVFSVYWQLSHRAQNRFLLVASYVFYAGWDWRFLGLILISTLVDYAVGSKLAENVDENRRRWLLTASVVTNLGILGIFKYAGFFVDSFYELLSFFGHSAQSQTLEIVLPVGISFYTFQTMSYTIDIYRRRLEPTRDFADFALFVAFFPQLVAGPIERAARLIPQITRPRTIDMAGIRAGSWLVLWGLFKKVVISDNIAALADAVYAPSANPQGAEILVATYAFAVQIYCDFSGYSDIARGLSRMLGFELMLNFDLPYLARNPSDFWRRWHISLSTWLRDYLYISLGGNRQGRRRTYRNLFLTMLLGGLWHGAAWNFVVWGAYHGALLAVHRSLRGVLERLAPKPGAGAWLWQAGSIVTMFHLTCLGWLLFRVKSMAQAGELVARLVQPWSFEPLAGWFLPFVVLVGPLVLIQLAQSLTDDLECVRRIPVVLRGGIYALLILGIIVLGEDFGQPFIYFQF